MPPDPPETLQQLVNYFYAYQFTAVGLPRRSMAIRHMPDQPLANWAINCSNDGTIPATVVPASPTASATSTGATSTSTPTATATTGSATLSIGCQYLQDNNFNWSGYQIGVSYYFNAGETVYISSSIPFDLDAEGPSGNIQQLVNYFYAYQFTATGYHHVYGYSPMPDQPLANWAINCSNDGTIPPTVVPGNPTATTTGVAATATETNTAVPPTQTPTATSGAITLSFACNYVQTESYYDGILYGGNAAGYFLPGETVYIYGSKPFDFSDNEPSPVTATGVYSYAYTFAADDHYSLTWNTPDYSDAQWSVGCSNDGTTPPPVAPEPTQTPTPVPTATVPQASWGCRH